MINNQSNATLVQASVNRAIAVPNKSFDPWIVWVTIRRYWPWAVPVGTLLACVTAIWINESFVPKYQASHWLQASNDYLVFKGVMPSIRDLAGTERSMFYSPIVIEPVLSNPRLRTAPSLSNPKTAERNLIKNLSLESGGTLTRLIVNYVDTDPKAAAMVANAIAEAYLNTRESFDQQQVDNLVKWLTPEIRRQEQVVEEKQQIVESLSKTTLGYLPGERVSTTDEFARMALFSALRGEISEMRVQQHFLEAKEKSILEDQGLPTDLSEFVPPPIDMEVPDLTESQIRAAIEQDDAVMQAKAEIDYYKKTIFDLEVNDMVRFDRQRHKELQEKRDEGIANLDKVKADARPRVIELLNELLAEQVEQRKRDAEVEYAQKEQEYKRTVAIEQNREAEVMRLQKKELATRLSVLEAEYEEERQRLEQFGGKTLRLQFAAQELELESETLKRLRARVAQFRTERQMDNSVRTLAAARVPSIPIETIPFNRIALGSGVAFCIPFLIGFVWEFKVQRVTDSKAVEHANLAPIVGELARLPSRSSETKGRRIFEESVDTMRATLFMSLENRDTRSIAVVSSMSGEGKSSVASQLALSIAKATGKTTLLVDTDLRCPDQHEIFGVPSSPGFSGVLAEKASIDEAINTSLGDLIHLLPAGRLSRSPHRLMNPAALKEFMQEILKKYDYVVFDTAPVLSAGETLALASVVDTTLLCVMRDVSRLENLTRTARRLEASGARISGTVFSGVSARQYAYRYGDYKYAVSG